MNTTRRRIIEATVASFLVGRNAHAKFGFVFGGGAGVGTGGGGPPPPPGPGTTLATVTLTNDGGGTQAAGTPTQSLGWLFKDGDVGPADAPQFQVSGVTQPFSAGAWKDGSGNLVKALVAYYPSGFLKFCVFSLRPTFSLGAGLSQQVTILNGGIWPTQSSRSLSEVYAATLAVSLPRIGITGDNLSANQGAWLTNDVNLVTSGAMAPSKDMDGDAGARWRLTTNCASSQGGTRHGQLAFDWYVHALNNSSGTLGAFRWGGCVTQPWYNQAGEGSSIPTKHWRAFKTPDLTTATNGPNWTASGVAARAMPWKGYDGAAIVAKTFTSLVNVLDGNGNLIGVACNVGANNWALGSSDSNIIPVYFTTTGTLPSPLNPNTIYFARIGQSSTAGAPIGTSTAFLIYSGSRANPDYLVSLSGGSGTHTINPVPATSPFCRTWFLADDGKYQFFQAAALGGTITAETTLRATIDRRYWQSTGLIPPWDLTLIGSGSVTDTAFNYPYHPHGIAACQYDADGQTGVVHGLGIVPNDCVLDFYKQTVRSERATRCYGYTWSHIAGNFKNATTNSLLNIGQPGITYTGLPATVGGTTFQWTSPADLSGQAWGAPPQSAYGMGMTSLGSTEHQANYPLWAWLRTGERQFCDFLQEMAIAGVVAEEPGFRDTDIPVVGRKCLALSFHNQWRTIAWRQRNLGQAAAFCPFDPTSPTTLGVDGTQHVRMLVANADLGYLQVKDAMTPANNYFGSSTSRFTTLGMWFPKEDFNGLYLVHSPEWEYSYNILGACLEASRAANTSNIVNFINLSATRWNHFRTDYGTVGQNPPTGFYSAFGYYVAWGVQTSENSHVGTQLLAYEYATPNCTGGTLSWQTTATAGSGNEFTDNVAWANGYSIHNGDLVLPDIRPAGMDPLLAYYVRNYNSGTKKFGMATDRAGASPVTITNTGTANATPTGGVSIMASNPLDWINHNAVFAMGTDSLLNMRASGLWMKAQLARLGVYSGQVDALNTDMENRRVNTAGGPYGPITTINYVDQTISDVRYCFADHYG